MMKKKSKNMVLAMMAAVFISGCQGNPSDKVVAPKDAAEVTKTTVNLMTHYAIDKDYQMKLINEFNENNSDVEIVVNMVGDKYSDVLNMAMATDEAPDIFSITGPSLTKKAVSLKWAEPLNSYMEPEFKAKFDPRVWVENNNTIGGETYNLPDQFATFRFLYNKDLMSKAGYENPPTTFEEFRDAAKKISEIADDTKGFALALGEDYMLDLTVFNGLGFYSLGSVHGFDYNTGKFDYAIYKPALLLMRQMKEDNSLVEGELLLKTDQARSKFADGKVGMIASASWETSSYSEMEIDFDIGVANWPSIDGQPKGKNTIQIGSGYAMYQKAKDKEAVWKALAFLGTDFSEKLSLKTGAISAIINDEGQSSQYANELIEFFMPNENDSVWPALVPALKMNGDAKQAVFIRLITNPDLDMDALLEDLNKRSNTAFENALSAGEFTKESYLIEGFDPINLN